MILRHSRHSRCKGLTYKIVVSIFELEHYCSLSRRVKDGHATPIARIRTRNLCSPASLQLLVLCKNRATTRHLFESRLGGRIFFALAEPNRHQSCSSLSM